MKKYKNYAILATVVILASVAVGCYQDNPAKVNDSETTDGLLGFLASWNPPSGQRGKIALSSKRYGTEASIINYGASGGIHATTNWYDTVTVYGGSMQIHGQNIPFDSTTNGYHKSFSSGSPPSFGSTASWSLAGNGAIPGFSTSMYVPTEILLQTPTEDSLSLSNLPTLTWNADASNPSGKIGIVITDYGSPHQKYLILTDDDGSHTLSSSDVGILSSGEYPNIDLVRGNSAEVGANDEYLIYAYSRSTRIYRVVP